MITCLCIQAYLFIMHLVSCFYVFYVGLLIVRLCFISDIVLFID